MDQLWWWFTDNWFIVSMLAGIIWFCSRHNL